MKRTIITLFVILIVMLALAAAAGAQDASAAPETLTDAIISIDEAEGLANDAIGALVAGVIGSPLVLVLVQALKAIPAFKDGGALQKFGSAPNLAVGTAFVLTLIGWLAQAGGYSDVFNSTTNLLTVAAPPLITLITGVAGANATFNGLNRIGSGKGFLGYARTPQQ